MASPSGNPEPRHDERLPPPLAVPSGPWSPWPRLIDVLVVMSSLHDRVRTIEGDRTPARKRRDSLEWLNSTVVSSIILGVFAYFLTGRAADAAKERELITANASQMQGLIVQLARGSKDSARLAALALTAFGRYAIPPLVANLAGESESAIAAEDGLISLAVTNKEDVCTTLADVLDSRSGRFTAQTHTAAIRILGTVECKESGAVDALRRYGAFLDRAGADSIGLADYERAVSDGLPSNVVACKREVERSLKLVGAR